MVIYAYCLLTIFLTRQLRTIACNLLWASGGQVHGW